MYVIWAALTFASIQVRRKKESAPGFVSKYVKVSLQLSAQTVQKKTVKKILLTRKPKTARSVSLCTD